MKHALRTLALLLTLCLLVSFAAFAEEDPETVIVGTWKASVIVVDGENTDITEQMPLIVNADHTGELNFYGQKFALTWTYSGPTSSSYVYDTVLTGADGETYDVLITYIFDYKDLTGMASVIFGSDLSVFYVK